LILMIIIHVLRKRIVIEVTFTIGYHFLITMYNDDDTKNNKFKIELIGGNYLQQSQKL